MDWHFPIFAEPGAFWLPTLVVAGLFGVRYILFAGAAYIIGYRCGDALGLRKLQPAAPTARQILREIGYSTVTVLLFGAVNGMLAARGVLPHTLLYGDVARHGWPWFALSIAAALVLHDTYFYWTHRLLHVRPIFRAVHRIHHLSTNPTPWAAYAFHPVESAVQAVGVVLIIFVLPIHPLALIAFQMISTAFNVYGHSGYELYGPEWPRRPIGRWINSSAAHNTHHAIARYNYGLYFLLWDRWLGTVDPERGRR